MPEIVGTFVSAKTRDEEANSSMQSWDSAGGDLAQVSLEFAEGHLDRVKVGGILRQIAKGCSRGLDRLADAGDLMLSRSKNRHSALRLLRIRRLRNAASSSMKVESGCSFTSPSINVMCSSSRDVLPPRGFGAVLPVSRQCCHHLTAVLTAIPKSSAASCRDIPDATASITRSRKSAE
jgi:hypothetical protein